ncbi:MAG: hypothetical protein JW724_03605 [Candidatus Altiarchaeota archaeon]|nr:hypothetical protein [Candidatus Altiarchaeota archaeon]
MLKKPKKKANKMKAGKYAKRKSKKNQEYLKDVPPEKSFWVSNGWVVRNMEELPGALENMSDETFAYHLNREKNDFSAWVREVVGDKMLASTLQMVKSRKSATDAIKRRIKQLK